MSRSPSTSERPASPPGSPGAPQSRRAEYRQATIDEIKTLARKQLAEHGPGALSLRAIAREMRTAPSALYRYFANYEELIGALCVDAYHSLADAVTAARDTQPPADHARQWFAVCHGYRRWSLDHPADFALIFGTPVPGYQAPEQVTAPAARRSTALLLNLYAEAVRSGAADPDRSQVPHDLQTGQFLHNLLGDAASDCPPRLAAIALSAYAALLGYLIAEIFGSLSRLIADTDQLYHAHIRTVMLGAGYDPALVDAADPTPAR